MAIAGDIKNLAEEIESSYGARVTTVKELIKETHKTLEGFQGDHRRMAQALKADLRSVKTNLAQGEAQRLEAFKAMNEGLKKSVEAIVRETARLLSDFSKEQREMAVALKEALTKGESERLGDFRRMLGEVQRRQEERVGEVRATLREFRKDQEEAHKHWRDLAKVMAARRAGKGAPAPKVAERVTEKAEEVRKEAPAEKPMTYREFFAYHRPRLTGSSKERMRKIGAMWNQYKRAQGIE